MEGINTYLTQQWQYGFNPNLTIWIDLRKQAKKLRNLQKFGNEVELSEEPDPENPGQVLPAMKVSLENAETLTDKDGQVWCGLIVDTDMVQHTLPGGR